MPIYEYRCNSCGHELEKLQRMSDASLTDCPACSESELRRLISPAGFRLKGSGWYETDFKSGNKRNVAETGSGSDSGSSKKDGDSAKESKTADSGKEKAASETSKSASKDKTAA